MSIVEREIWEGFVPGLQEYDLYKFAITGPDGEIRMKADPYAFHAETRPGTASKLYDIRGMNGTIRRFGRSGTGARSAKHL